MIKISSAAAMVFTVGLAIAPAAAQQAYPSRPVRIIVPFPPGGTTNLLARMLGQKLTDSWGQQVIVDNRGGANTIIGAEAAAKSAPDGYTILLTTSTHVIVPLLFRTPYDAIKDFAPVATLANQGFVLVLHPSLPANNLNELIAVAKAKPGQLNHASASGGSVSHLAIELFNMMTGVKIQNIPYKGGGPAVTDLLGGQVQLMFANPINVAAHIKSGKLRAIAITGEARLATLPQVPTAAEADLPGFDATNWFGILAPSGTPKDAIEKLSAEVARFLALPDVSRTLASLGNEPLILPPAQFAALMKADTAKYAKVIKTANIKAHE